MAIVLIDWSVLCRRICTDTKVSHIGSVFIQIFLNLCTILIFSFDKIDKFVQISISFERNLFKKRSQNYENVPLGAPEPLKGHSQNSVNLFRSNEIYFVRTISISFERYLISFERYLFRSNDIYFVRTKSYFVRTISITELLEWLRSYSSIPACMIFSFDKIAKIKGIAEFVINI